MTKQFEILDDIINSSVPTELVFEKILSLNKYLEKNDEENILYVNIRSFICKL